MKLLKNTSNIFIITLILASLTSWYFFFRDARQNDTVDVKHFPKIVGTWTAEDLPITEDEYAILETRNAFARRYTNSLDNNMVYLYIVYSQNNRKVSHPPEVCYTGSGITIDRTVRDTIQVGEKNLTIEINRLHLSKRNYEHIAFYWFKVGAHFTANYWKQQVLIVLNTITGRNASSALIRVSADVDSDEEKAIQNIKSFTSLIIPDLMTHLP
jgi:EpsI family protein